MIFFVRLCRLHYNGGLDFTKNDLLKLCIIDFHGNDAIGFIYPFTRDYETNYVCISRTKIWSIFHAHLVFSLMRWCHPYIIPWILNSRNIELNFLVNWIWITPFLLSTQPITATTKNYNEGIRSSKISSEIRDVLLAIHFEYFFTLEYLFLSLYSFDT